MKKVTARKTAPDVQPVQKKSTAKGTANNSLVQKKGNNSAAAQMQALADSSAAVMQQKALQQMADKSVQQRKTRGTNGDPGGDGVVQRMLMDQSGYELTESDIKQLKVNFPGHTVAIDTHSKSTDWYIVRGDIPSGQLAFFEHQHIPDQREHSHLKRTAFTSTTQKQVPVSHGEHRRHIISNHLMKLAIGNWQQAHKSEMTTTTAQQLLDKLNNYQPNLIPGRGAENSAIGMFTNHASGIHKGAQGFMSSLGSEEFSANLGVNLGMYTGFQQQKQAELIDPVLPVFSDSSISQSHHEALRFTEDLRDSTDFDWPEGADPSLYHEWIKVYQWFLNIAKSPDLWDKEHFEHAIQTFLSLPKPTK